VRRLLVLASRVGLLLLATLAGSLPAAAAGPDRAARLRLGQHLYGRSCITCHGARGAGIESPSPRRGAGNRPGLGPSLRGVGALAADFYLRTGYMPLQSPYDVPVRKRSPFSGDQIDALVAYVASLGQGPPVPKPNPERGSLSTGLKLFTEHCAGCHQVAAEGGVVTGARVPPLENATAVQVAEAVRIGPYLMPRFSKTQISDRELDSLVRYVEYAKHPRDEGGWAIGHLGPFPEGMVAWLVGGSLLVGLCVVIGKRVRE
jgi:quinol---cytochrome-c reductase cytochrome c subunit